MNDERLRATRAELPRLSSDEARDRYIEIQRARGQAPINPSEPDRRNWD